MNLTGNILPAISRAERLIFYYKHRCQTIYFINGKEIAKDIPQEKKGNSFDLDPGLVQEGTNHITIVALPLKKIHPWDRVNTHPGLLQLTIQAEPWQRKLFNGLAQVILQSTGDPGEIRLRAISPGLRDATITINAR